MPFSPIQISHEHKFDYATVEALRELFSLTAETQPRDRRCRADIFSNAHVGISITLPKPAMPASTIFSRYPTVLIERVAVKLERREKICLAGRRSTDG